MTTKQTTIWQVFKAVLGAFIGVQSEKQRLHDFQSRSAVPFIITGILLAAAFVGILILIVSLVLR
ncbi:DUF2970 domain-containing protein [Alishewanella tabrizica]|uniref:DUF2970 domain-containing protein n=1 Tax=Alishewanella tabrizica TaxID=671278 RepID=A0ABQ2WEA6_9ALTE|nr:DUF2970 domain-containing protein [Alishewanella tabrizica]GGW52201.1 hypothetical protein GCM10008111_05250 [Alishewanella tabrizica]